MTGRATYGELAGAASACLARAVSLAGQVAAERTSTGRQMHAGYVRRHLHALAVVMSRYFDDFSGATYASPDNRRPLPLPWAKASAEAQQQIRTAAALLAPDRDITDGTGERRTAGLLDHALGSAVASLAAGRDLLGTHVAADQDRALAERSEWVPVISSVPVSAALITELGLCARLAAACGRQLAELEPPGARRIPGAAEDEARQRLTGACQALHRASTAIARAHHVQPASAADVRLLHAIPANVLPEHQTPTLRDDCATLRLGAIASAQRLRHFALTADPGAIWAPDLTARALRETAASATAISHHCAVILRTLATASPDPSDGLLQSAEAAEAARDSWLKAARSWQHIAAHGQAADSALAAEAQNLAVTTGRLAYADPAWSLAQGPRRPARPVESLAPEPGDIGRVVAVAHHACQALDQLAVRNHEHVRLGAENGRYYVPTRGLPGSYDITRPFVTASPRRLVPVLHAYADARQASRRATATIAVSADAVHAPSTILTSAQRALDMRRTGLPEAGQAAEETPPATPAVAGNADLPGHYERLLTELGQTNTELLRRAAALDLAGEELVIETARTIPVKDLAWDVETSAKALNVEWRTKSLAKERAASLEREAEL